MNEVTKTFDKDFNKLKFAGYLLKNNLISNTFQDPGHVALAIEMAIAYGAKNSGEVFLKLKNMYFMNRTKTINIYGELPLALVQKSEKLESFEEFFIDSENKKISYKNQNLVSAPVAGVCILKRKELKSETEFVLTLNEVFHMHSIALPQQPYTSLNEVLTEFRKIKYKSSGMLPIWNQYPLTMWKRRLRAFALKSVFPDVLTGSSIGEYDEITPASIPNPNYEKPDQVVDVVKPKEEEKEEKSEMIKKFRKIKNDKKGNSICSGYMILIAIYFFMHSLMILFLRNS